MRSDRCTAFVGEHETELVTRLELSHMTGERRRDDGRQRHCPERLLRLEIAVELNATTAAVTSAHADELAVDLDGATQNINANCLPFFQAARRRTSRTVTAMSSADSTSSQPPSIHWNGQNRLAGW